MFQVIIDSAEEEDFMGVTSFTFGTYELAVAFIKIAMSHQEVNYTYTIEKVEKVENNG